MINDAHSRGLRPVSNDSYSGHRRASSFRPPATCIRTQASESADSSRSGSWPAIGHRYEDGGYVVKLEAKNAATGVVIGRADLMHVASPQVTAGAVVGPWTTLGYLSRFRYSSCYQVSNDAGVHVHAEFIDAHKYSCYIWRGNGAAINENTTIGRSGAHYGGQRAAC